MVDVEPEVIKVSEEGEDGTKESTTAWDAVEVLENVGPQSVVEEDLEVLIEAGKFLGVLIGVGLVGWGWWDYDG